MCVCFSTLPVESGRQEMSVSISAMTTNRQSCRIHISWETGTCIDPQVATRMCQFHSVQMTTNRQLCNSTYMLRDWQMYWSALAIVQCLLWCETVFSLAKMRERSRNGSHKFSWTGIGRYYFVICGSVSSLITDLFCIYLYDNLLSASSQDEP